MEAVFIDELEPEISIHEHLPYGFSSIKLRAITAAGPQFGPTGYEINLLYLAALLILAVAPPGPLSVDAWLDKRRNRLHSSA